MTKTEEIEVKYVCRNHSKYKILIADVLLVGKPHFDWKEGYELCYAFRKLGHECDVAGPGGKISELMIPKISIDYDYVIITENYPRESKWKWWDWKSIKTPKMFWAIDTHLKKFLPWLKKASIDFVAFNNYQDLVQYNLKNSFFMTYAVSKKHHMIKYTDKKTRDVVFIGGHLPERERMCQKFGIECVNAYGPDYIKEMQASKICFNQSMSYDINAKYFEILSSGTFMLTNYNKHFYEFLDYNPDIEKMFYYDESDLASKINYYLKNDSEREAIAKRVTDYMYRYHAWENRAELILDSITN